jgi:sialic acid synthase SpsE/mannose-6-phosphate isomerase-like protein (cupin superfamily)
MKKPLFIFEMANNHMGDISHGKKIVQKLKEVTKKIKEFDFSVKLQYRDESFFHPDHINRKDHKLIKRFTETRLGSNFQALVDEIRSHDFITMCTPWDELASEFLVKIKIDIIKIASCSFNDWHLLESVAKIDKEIIASVAGVSKLDIDKVYSFFKNKKKNFSFMHCVGEYPTPDENLELSQIDYLIKNYPDIRIGYSTHEKPDNNVPIAIAIAKGASIFEKHVGLKTDIYNLNEYSASPEMISEWLNAALKAYKICGNNKDKRKLFSSKEESDLKILYRGAYVKNSIKKNTILEKKDIFLAMPNIEGQLVAKDLGMFVKYTSKFDLNVNQPIMFSDVLSDTSVSDLMDRRFYIKDMIKEKINLANIIIPKNVKVEISHHYGIKKFFDTGAVLFHIINKEYSKILVMMFPNQKYPAHHHVKKNETYLILDGDLEVNIKNEIKYLQKGDMLSVNNNVIHSFKTKNGVIFEEIATEYIQGDSKYVDYDSMDSNRKTEISIFE